jgi:hypothetical protein
MPLPRNTNNPEEYKKRDVSRLSEEALQTVSDIHERMRVAGIPVVKYEIEITPNAKYFKPETVEGVALRELPAEHFRRELGGLALGWHEFFTQATKDKIPYYLFDVMGSNQYMYGVTPDDPVKRTRLVDIDPTLEPFQKAIEEPSGKAGSILGDELAGLQEWAEPHWKAHNMPPFPVHIPTAEEQSKARRRAMGLE